MSEIKRAQLIPLTSQKDTDKTPKEPRKTIRISVALPESTEDTCPEYNYKDELAAAKKLGRYKDMGGTVNGLSKLDDMEDDDDVKRIARQMEEKYGTGTSLNKKKRKGRKDDYADIGMGYDESDSFIDNTDGYDEMIPQNVTTLHGGFYINSGALEFKTDDEADSDLSSSSSDDESSKKATGRKRVIESSDETDRENKTEAANATNHDKKRKLQNGAGGNGLQQSIKKKLLGSNSNKILVKKRRLLDPQKKTVKELLREKREDLNMSIPEDLKTDVSACEDKEKETIISSNVADVIESVVKASIGEQKKSPETNTKKVVNLEQSSHETPERIKAEVKLPENLPADILSVITAIKTAAENCNFENKTSFSSEINLLILRLERKSKCLGKPSKMKVYEHLSLFLKCKTEVLLKRAKVLVLDDEQKKLKNLLSSLKSEISKIMPGLLENYEKESQRILQKKFAPETMDSEESKSLRMPKRRFQWNDVSKKQLRDILMLKKRCLLLEGKTKEVLDTQMTAFLKNEIQVLWPDGWMSMNALNKIYTTYADPKRLMSNGTPSSVSSTNSTPAAPVKTLPPTFNSSLSITPVIPKSEKSERVSSEVKCENTINLSIKSLPETQPCDKPVSPKRELEGKLKVKPASELFKPSVSNHVLKDERDRFSPKVKPDDYCQVIDLSDKTDYKSKIEKPLPKREKTISPMISDQIHVSKHPELSITPSFSKADKPKPSDDIQKVMENLKVLQKMSSPKKCVDAAPTSSAVSVIAVNKSFAPKSVHENPTMQRYDYNKTEFNTSFQDEFQKQLFSAFNQFPPNTTKNYNRYPHIASSGAGMVTNDKYFQSSNNNYTQSSNGHKNNSTSQQPGTYNLLDDMFANLLTQYGYSKEATAPKSQPK